MWKQESLSQLFSPSTNKKNTNNTSADKGISIPEADALKNDPGKDEEISPFTTNIAVNLAQRNNLAPNIEKDICHGCFGMKDNRNRIIQQSLKAKLEYYYPYQGGNIIIKLIPSSSIYSVLGIYCTIIVDVEEQNLTNPSK